MLGNMLNNLAPFFGIVFMIQILPVKVLPEPIVKFIAFASFINYNLRQNNILIQHFFKGIPKTRKIFKPVGSVIEININIGIQ